MKVAKGQRGGENPPTRARFQQRIVEQFQNIPVPEIVEEIVQVVKMIPQERIQNSILEQIQNVPVPQVVEKTLEVVKMVLRRW